MKYRKIDTTIGFVVQKKPIIGQWKSVSKPLSEQNANKLINYLQHGRKGNRFTNSSK